MVLKDCLSKEPDRGRNGLHPHAELLNQAVDSVLDVNHDLLNLSPAYLG